MEEEVKAIFKALIGIWVIIIMSFFIFNIVAFTLTYQRMLGISSLIAQEAVENNYLTASTLNTLNDYLGTFTTFTASDGTVTTSSIIPEAHVYTNVSTDKGYTSYISPATVKRQYGNKIKTGVQYTYHFIWPLVRTHDTAGSFGNTTSQSTGDQYVAINNSSYTGVATSVTPTIQNNKSIFSTTIAITYVIPGLKYYPDLSN